MSGRHGYSKTGLENLRREQAAAGTLGRWRRVRPLVALVVFVAASGAFFALIFGVPIYDRSHRVDLVCDVSGAAVGITAGRYSHRPYVRVTSSDCGTLVLFRGVTRDNQGDIAEKLTYTPTWRFSVGEAALHWRGVLSVLKSSPEITRYEPA